MSPAAGLGMLIANGFQKIQAQNTPVSGIDGFDVKQIASDAKDRVTTFFRNFSDKTVHPGCDTRADAGTV